MGEVAMLWFRCKNPNCDKISEKDKKNYRKGKIHSIAEIETYRRRFMRYVNGHRIIKDGETFFSCKYGNICIYSEYQNMNSYIYPIEDKELCSVCYNKSENEKRLFV